MQSEQEFVDEVYSLLNESQNETLLYIWTEFDKVELNYQWMDNVLALLDVNKLNLTTMVCVLLNTRRYSKYLENHILFWKKVYDIAVKEEGESEAAKNYIDGLIDEGDYWKTMKMFNAPETISGINPHKN